MEFTTSGMWFDRCGDRREVRSVRTPTRHLILALEEFQSLGVDFIGLNESIDTSTAKRQMVFTVLSAVAELERNIIRERVTAGLRRARKEGKTLGRPRVIVDREKVQQLQAKVTACASLPRIADRSYQIHRA